MAGLLHGRSVLVVEDHDDTREMLTAGLAEHGAKVMAATTAQMATLLLDAAMPDVMVVDLGLPDVDGWTFLRAMRNRSEDFRVPAVALTAHNSPDDRRKSVLAGFNLHVPKPITVDELAGKLASLLVLLSGPAER